ncbi:MAG: hypothetical protein H7Y60_06525 [Rhodospirillaceae bacterium]|nr:hypothetical protein [Rhodospirillales bacterium]
MSDTTTTNTAEMSTAEMVQIRRERTAAFDNSRGVTVSEERMASAQAWARDSKSKEDEALLSLGKTQQLEAGRQ